MASARRLMLMSGGFVLASLVAVGGVVFGPGSLSTTAVAQGLIPEFPDASPEGPGASPGGPATSPEGPGAGPGGPATSPPPSDCVGDAEPNDAPETATAIDAPTCIAGTLPDGDQDLFIWTIPDAQVGQPWDITVDGIANTVTGAKILAITSPPGETPLVIGSQMLEVGQAPDAFAPTTVSGVLMPAGRYLVGITRSATADSQPPKDISYLVSIVAARPLAPSGDVEPNDDHTSAAPISGTVALSGDLRDGQDVYRWSTPDLPDGKAWDVRLTGTLTSGAQVAIEDADGTRLTSANPDALGVAQLSDVRLPGGDHYLVISPSSSVSMPYALAVTQTDLGAADPEPNSTVPTAIVLDPTHPIVHGRLADGDTQDWYSLDVDQTMAASLLDIRLIWRSGPSRRLCLADPAGTTLQCRDGDTGVALSGLHLPPGPVTLQVSGDPSDTSSYLLRLDVTTAPAADFESEPNDLPSVPSDMSGLSIRGAFGRNDTDTLRATTTGDPQLWQVDVVGSGVNGLVWEQADGTQLGIADVDQDHTGAHLVDMYLIPGQHWFRVDGSNGDYTLTLTPLGPPDPNGEREPNNQSISAEPFVIGSTRTGRLPSYQDADVFRFSLATNDHIRVTLTPPADGDIRMRLSTGTLRTGDIPGVAGTPTTYDAQLLPGDYELWLTPDAPSRGKYSLKVERQDPFAFAVDQEPNDSIPQARPLPRSRHIEGDGPVGGDDDWFVLGSLPTGGDLPFRSTGNVHRIIVSDGVTDYEGTIADDGSDVISGLPAGIPLWLRIATTGPYTVDVGSGGTGLTLPFPEGTPPEVNLGLTLDQPRVAAYWAAGQQITGTLTVQGTGAEAQQLVLDSATSDPDWSIGLAQTQVGLPARGRLDIPVTVTVLPDATVDDAVRLTVRARNAAGGATTGWISAVADPDTAPVAPSQGWSVPDAFLGGLNVAGAALGATPVVSIDPAAEAQLYDGVTPSSSGFLGTMSGAPMTLTVDLAGDASIPIAGMALDPLAGRMSSDPVPRHVALLLSDDGATWQEVLTGELSPLNVDQWFALPTPVPARFAQLRIDSTWGGTSGPVALGEWKVIAVPGAVPDPMSADIADPARGGHVVWMAPQASSQGDAQMLLTDDPSEYPLDLPAKTGDTQTFVVGFQDDRQASLVGMEWVDPVASDAQARMRTVDVAISTTSPVGPWEPVGTWDLARADDGSVAPFTFPEPTWARFVRFTGSPLKKDRYAIEEPATVRILEAPTSDRYRSVVAEWGSGSPSGPRDWIEPPDLSIVADANDGDDTPETARVLQPGVTAEGRAHRDQDVDWYQLTVPSAQNSISIRVGGVPAVGVALTLFDQDGQTVPMTFGPASDGRVEYQANVHPGATYRVQVRQPPFSAVFEFDTSGSMGNYLPFVTEALRAYTGGVIKGDEQVKVQPFEEQPLLADWSDDPYVLEDGVNRWVEYGGSSGAEAALIDASRELSGREGARAVLLITDADTSSYQSSQELWAALEGTRPMVFAVHVGGDSVPQESTHFMQDWASVGGGYYQYVVSHGEMDQAFSRMATWLRRPAAYSLDLTTSEVELPPPPPATLSVVAVGPTGEPTQAPASKDVAVDIILDTSGSMLDRFGGKSRIESAKAVLHDLVTEQLPPGAPVAVRVLGSKAQPCGTRLAVPFGPLDPDTVTGIVDRLKVDAAADTPIGAALAAVPRDLADATGTRVILLITDSKEIWPNPDLCGKDPQAVIRDLQRQGIDARLNIIGMAVTDKKARRQMTKWAKLGGGAYFDTRDRQQLDAAIRVAVSAPFQVLDQAGTVVASGTVGGAPVKVPPGTYRVVVLSDPPVTFEGIVLTSDGSLTLTLPSDAGRVVPTPAPQGSPGPAGSPSPAASSAP